MHTPLELAESVLRLTRRLRVSGVGTDARVSEVLAGSKIHNSPNLGSDACLAVFAKNGDAAVAAFDRRFKAIGGCSIPPIL
jgi:predicted nucleic acid-binding protein